MAIWKGGSWFGYCGKWYSPWWNHGYVSRLSVDIHLTEMHRDHKLWPPSIMEEGRASSPPVLVSCIFYGIQSVWDFWTSSNNLRLSGAKSHIMHLEGHVLELWELIAQVFIQPLKSLGEKDEGDQQGCPKTVKEQKENHCVTNWYINSFALK